MPFISITHLSKTYRFKVELISRGIGAERFEIIAKNKRLIIESDRPNIKRQGLNQKVKWKLVSGDCEREFLELIFGAVEEMS